jgi:sugar/nucleoside kinase (ribokinase family)
VSRRDYVAVGHVTCDVFVEGSAETRRAGGTAFYSALQAARLGLSALIVTQGVRAEIEELMAPYEGEVDLHVIPAAHTTTLSTGGAGTGGAQRLLTWAGPIVEPIDVDAGILHLAPVARETPADWRGRADFVGITPQGLVRGWEQSEAVPLAQLEAASLVGDIPLVPPGSDTGAAEIVPVELDRATLPERFDAAVISEAELTSCRGLFSAARECGACVAVTAGPRATTVHPGDAEAGSVAQTAMPERVAVRDDIGAGDVFAAAFFVALAEGRAALEAATFANAAACARIAGVGPQAIARRRAITP